LKNVLILTIGQRDLQLVIDGEYYIIGKDRLKSIQNYLKSDIDNLSWISVDKLKFAKEKLDKKSDKITFPMIENLFLYFKKNQINIDQIYIFYTDRQHFKDIVKERFLDSEPYIFNKIFIHFEKEILKYHEMDTEIKYINIGEEISDINSDNLYPFIGDKFNTMSTDNNDNIYIAVAGGIPAVRGTIENLGTLYFPENCIILNQNFGSDIELSRSHLYQKYYRDYNLLRYSIKKWDFAKAFEVYKEINNKKDLAFEILEMINNILFIDVNEAMGTLEHILNSNLDNKEKEKFKKIKLVLESENPSFMIFIKFLQVYKNGNYWAAIIILITLFENFIKEIVEVYYNGSVVIMNEKGYFAWKKINFKWDPNKTSRDYIFKKNNKDYLNTNWSGISEVIKYILPEDKGQIFGFIKNNLLSKSQKLKKLRNDFIHNGGSVLKSELLKVLNINKNSKVKTFFGSSILTNIFTELKRKNPDYFNWLEFFEELLLKEIKELKPNIR